MATQAEIITQVRAMLDEASAAQWTEQHIRTWINNAAQDIARKTECNRTSATKSTTASTGEYTFTENIVRVHRASWSPTSDSLIYPLEYKDYHSLDNHWWLDQSSESSHPMFYTTWGKPGGLIVKLWPVPSTAGVLTLFYYAFPARLSEDSTSDASTTIDIPAGWDELIVDYAEYHALRRDRDPRWQEAKAEYLEKLSDLATAAIRFNDQAGTMDWYGNPSWLTAFDWMD